MAAKGIPGLLTLTPRRAFNMAYYWVVRYMKEEDRKAFDDYIKMTKAEMIMQATEAAIHEELMRQHNIRQIAEVG